MGPVSSIAFSGLQSAVQRFGAAADGIARQAPEADPVSDTLSMITAKHDFAANLAVLRAENGMLGQLLDIKA